MFLTSFSSSNIIDELKVVKNTDNSSTGCVCWDYHDSVILSWKTSKPLWWKRPLTTEYDLNNFHLTHASIEKKTDV